MLVEVDNVLEDYSNRLLSVSLLSVVKHLNNGHRPACNTFHIVKYGIFYLQPQNSDLPFGKVLTH